MNFFVSLKNRLFQRGTAALGALGGIIYLDGDVDAGCIVDQERAMEIAAYCAAFNLLVKDAGAIPLTMYQKTTSGPQKAEWTQEGRRFKFGPNNYQTTQDWVEQVMTHLLGYGDYYAYRYQVGGRFDSLDSIENPDRVVTYVEQGRQVHQVTTYADTRPLGTRTCSDQEIFHIHGPSADGYSGRKAVDVHRQTLSLARAVFRYGARWFANGAQPRGILVLPAGAKTEDIARAKELYKTTYGGDNIHEIAVYGNGTEFKPISVDPEKSQALGTRQQVTKEICAILDVPLWRFYNETPPSLDARTSYYMLTIRPHVKRIADNINKQLLGEDPNFYVEANLDAVLQADIKTRYEAYGVGIQNRFMNPNQAAAKENLPTYPGGEQYINPHTLDAGTNAALRGQ